RVTASMRSSLRAIVPPCSAAGGICSQELGIPLMRRASRGNFPPDCRSGSELEAVACTRRHVTGLLVTARRDYSFCAVTPEGAGVYDHFEEALGRRGRHSVRFPRMPRLVGAGGEAHRAV